MRNGVIQVKWFLACRDPAHQPLIEAQTKLSYLVRVQPFGGSKYQLLTRFIAQINRAHIRPHRRSNLSNNQIKRIFKRISIVNILNQPAEQFEHQRPPRRLRAGLR